MKIIFVGGVNVPNQGGIESYVFNMARQLKAKGHDCRIICRGNEKTYYQAERIKIWKESVSENSLAILKHNFKASLTIWRYYRDFDVVNYQSIYLPFFYEWIPKLRGIKVVHTQHSFAQDNPKHGRLSRIIISVLYRISALLFSPVITVSEQNRKLIRKRLWRDAKVINCGVDFPKEVKNTDVLKQHEIKKGKYYLTIGRIDPVKNLDVLIRAFRKHEMDKDLQLVIAGGLNNNYAEMLKELAEGDKRIIFTGPVFGNDKEMLLNCCMAYCLVSTSEGFPIALLEAMSHGRVCLCSNIPASKETLTEPLGLWSEVKNDALLYESMKELEENPEKYSGLGEKVRERILSSLTWDKIADQYVEYLHELVSDDKRRLQEHELLLAQEKIKTM